MKSQGPVQEQTRAVLSVWLCTLRRFRLFLPPAGAGAHGRAQGLVWDLAELCEQEIWELLGACYCCSSCWLLLLYWSPECIINSPYQCIVYRHRSAQAAAVRANQPSFLPSFPAFPVILGATGEHGDFPQRWCPWWCLALVGCFSLSSPSSSPCFLGSHWICSWQVLAMG